jgi:hypothetical protein
MYCDCNLDAAAAVEVDLADLAVDLDQYHQENDDDDDDDDDLDQDHQENDDDAAFDFW